jgi:hypothetical protein
MKLLVALLMALLSLSLSLSAMTPKAKFAITFHAQGDEISSPRSIFRMNMPGYTSPVVFEKIPQFSHQQIAAFHSFPADDGETLGLTLQLDFRGKNALNVLTRTRTGQLLIALVNGQPVDFVMIDTPINDGIITIWRGVTQQVIDELAKKYPPINKLESVSTGHDDMLPTTKGEKRRSVKEAKAQKATEKKVEQAVEASKTEPVEKMDLLDRGDHKSVGSFDPTPAKPEGR